MNMDENRAFNEMKDVFYKKNRQSKAGLRDSL